MLAEAFDYKQWADRRALDAIRRVGPPPSAAFMRQQLNHMVIVEELFRARLLGVPAPHPSTNTDLVPELDELADRLIESDRWFARYVAGLQPGSRSESISFQF
ncbi:MAG TPA: DinB family protein, partial [Casimicrobiaceae bacterium]|nr:DinB family protein [Casimicrobiaceae bacterium]